MQPRPSIGSGPQGNMMLQEQQQPQQRAVSSMNLSNQSFKISSTTAASSQSGRSPIVGTTLGKFILVAKGKSNIRLNQFVGGKPEQPYESVVGGPRSGDDFELMKTVQNWIDENSHRYSLPTVDGNKQTSFKFNKNSIPLSFIEPDDDGKEDSQLLSEDNIFFQGFKQAQKADARPAGPSRRNIRLVHNQNSSQLFNNGPNGQFVSRDHLSSQNISRKGQRNSSVLPQRESGGSVIRGVNQDNLFLQRPQESHNISMRRHEQLIDRIFRASKDGSLLQRSKQYSKLQSNSESEAENVNSRSEKKQLLTPDGRVNDPWAGLEVRCLGPSTAAIQPNNLNFAGVEKQSKELQRKVKSLPHHQGFQVKRYNAAAYIQMNEQKLNTQDLQRRDLKLIGNQFQSKAAPESVIGNLEIRKTSQDGGIDGRELLLYLQRRYHDFPNMKDFEERLQAIKKRIEERNKSKEIECESATIDQT